MTRSHVTNCWATGNGIRLPIDTDPNNEHVSMSLCCVRLLAARSLRSALPTAVDQYWGTSFGRQWSSSVAEDREHGTDGVPLKSVQDLPTPGNTWSMMWNMLFPADNLHEQRLQASLSSDGKLYRVPIPIPGRHLITTSSPKHVSDMFRNEGEIPCRLTSDHLEQFMVEKGFVKGLVIS